MARVLTVGIGAVAGAIGLVVVGVGVRLVLRGEVDAVGAAMLGGLALAVMEGGAVLVRRLVLDRVGRGTFAERLLVLTAVVLVALLVAVLAGSGVHPSAAGVVLGAFGTVALVAVVVSSALSA
jgi:hypothetical protein